MKQMKKGTLKKVLKRIKRYRLFILFSLLCAVVSVALGLYLPILTGEAIDLLLGPGEVRFSGLWPILLQMGVLIWITALAQWIMNLCNNRVTYCVTRDMRQEAIARIEELPLSYLDTHGTGEIVSRVIADVDQFADGLLMGFTQLFTGVMTILGTLFFMFRVDVVISLVVVCLTPLSLFVAAFIAKRTYSRFREQSEIRGKQTAFVDEMIGNQKVVQAFGRETRAPEQFDEINDELQACSLKAIFYSSITNPATRFVNNLVYAAVCVIGAFSVLRRGISVGQISALLSYANQYTKPFNEISGVITELQNALACAERIFDFINETPQTEEKKEELTSNGHVELNNVNFSYVE